MSPVEPTKSDLQDEPAGGGAPGASPAAAVPAEPDELSSLHGEVEKLRDENLRLIARARNEQQRAQREKAEALKYAEAEFARELLVVLDDLERLRASAATPSENPSLEDGLRIVYEHFLKVLKSRGIEALHALGQPFNPQYHEALYQQPSAEYPAGTVAQELARGYRMYERVLRPARVAVSAGPSAPAEAGQPDAAAKESQE